MTQSHKRFASPLTRRSFLQRAGICGAAVLDGALWPKILAAGSPRPQSGRPPLNHVIISCQENRSLRPLLRLRAAGSDCGLRATPGLLAAGWQGWRRPPIRVHKSLDA